MTDFDRFMVRAWRYLPLALLVAAIAGYATGSWWFGQGQ